MRKAPLTRIPVPNPASIYARMGTGMGMLLKVRMGTVKQSPVLPHPVAIPILNDILTRDNIIIISRNIIFSLAIASTPYVHFSFFTLMARFYCTLITMLYKS